MHAGSNRHPIFMSIGCTLFLAQGVISYRNRTIVNAFAPIMQHSKKRKARAVHQALQVRASGNTAILLVMRRCAAADRNDIHGVGLYLDRRQ